MEINVLKPNKVTFNTAYIIFEDKELTRRWMDVMKYMNVPFTFYITKKGDKTYYGFKMFRIKKKFFSLCIMLQEVLE